MILVVGQYPDERNSRDGMVQRIAAIDRLLEPHERVYVTLVHEPFRDGGTALTQVAPGVRRAQLNWFDADHVERFAALAREARAVVVHSIHWAQHVLPLYRARPVLTDLHGVVPEEHAFVGAHAESEHFARVESFVLRHGWRHLVVSDAMGAHLRQKYPQLQPTLITLPVLSPAGAPTLEARRAPGLRVLYSGGTHAWQNIEPMLQAIARAPASVPVELLTPDVAGMSAAVARHGLQARVAVRSVPPEQMPAEYARAHLGFVLRDDNVVNRAACPTKLQEYLAHGVVPIVLSPHIGDFATLGYRTLALEAFVAGALPSWESWREMAQHNLGVMEALRVRAASGTQLLQEALARPPAVEEAPGVSRVDEELVAARLMAQRMTPARRRTRRLPLPLLRRLLP
jgi:hypothetical protein